MLARLFFDGACRGNGGRHAHCAVGYVLEKDGQVLATGSKLSSARTNNQAEYKALWHGLRRAREMGIRRVICFGDSLLVVRQMNHQMNVFNPALATLRTECLAAAAPFAHVQYRWIPRDRNAAADRLANEALDREDE